MRQKLIYHHKIIYNILTLHKLIINSNIFEHGPILIYSLNKIRRYFNKINLLISYNFNYYQKTNINIKIINKTLLIVTAS